MVTTTNRRRRNHLNGQRPAAMGMQWTMIEDHVVRRWKNRTCRTVTRRLEDLPATAAHIQDETESLADSN